jgi:type II secretory pathway pseudopilin PulG
MTADPTAGLVDAHATQHGTGRRSCGMSLAECLIALALLSLTMVMVTAGFATVRATGERLLAQRAALRAAENALEAVRGGALPLASGPVDPRVLVGDAGEWRLRVRVLVDETEQPGLYQVVAEAAFELGERPGMRRLETLVWQP